MTYDEFVQQTTEAMNQRSCNSPYKPKYYDMSAPNQNFGARMDGCCQGMVE
jgi:hypothetical protein